MSDKTIGIAGCGAMGMPMAKALLDARYKVCGFDIRPPEDFGGFSKHMITNPEQFSDQCDIVICVVRDQSQVLDLCFDDQAIFNNPSLPKTLVLSSTVSPKFVHALRNKLNDDISLIDAPMSGAPLAAIDKTLTFMVGGPDQSVKELLPLFAAMGSKTHHLGELGTGMTAKVLNNFVAASTVVAVRNVLHHANQLGMDRQTLLSVMQQSSGQTWFGSNFEKIDWATQIHTPENTIGILEKDVRCFIDTLDEESEPLHKAIIAALQTLPPLPA